jgi:Holliday junction resolvase
MSIRRHDPKRDGNERDIVKALEAVGCRVERLDAIDLLALRSGVVYLLEIKTPESRRRLTTRQRRMIEEGWPIVICTSAEEALNAVGVPVESH